MIALLVGFFVKRGIQSRFAAPLAYISAFVAALLLLASLWGVFRLIVHHHDKGVIGAYENGVQAQVAAETNTATAKADAQANITAARDDELHNEVQEAINNAVAAHPEEARRPAGRVSQSALDRLRHRSR